MRRNLHSLFGRRRPDGEPAAWWHAQDLNDEDRHGRRRFWKHARCWFHWYGFAPGERSHKCVGFEWNLWKPHDPWPKVQFTVNDTFGDDFDLTASLSVPWLFSFYVNVEGFFPDRLKRWIGYGRQTGVSLYEEYLWINFWWSDPAETWGESKNRFPSFHITFDWKSFLFGKTIYTRETLTDWADIQVPLPEATYPAKARIERQTWRRSRWPGKRVRVYANIESERGIPVPGKGENSWDCGEDAIMGLGSEPTLAAAVAQYVKSVLETRERYGGSINWRPRERAESE